MKIVIDTKAKTTPTDFSWQGCIGDDHAKQLLRTDFVADLKKVHDELGIKAVRFHGIFDDDMTTLQTLGDVFPIPGVDAIKEENFRQCGKVYDNVLSTGMKPYVELSFMPSHLADGTLTTLHYKNNICPPKDYEAWAAYIGRFVQFLIDRYGKKEVESWPFEVWNEPDLFTFFHGTQEEYFKLYKYTVEAIKKIDPAIKVGGPSTSGCRWVKEFQDYCKTNNVPYDFVSTHHYPGDGFGNTVSNFDQNKMVQAIQMLAKSGKSLSDTVQLFFFHPDKLKDMKKGILTEFDQQTRELTPDKPLYISEFADLAVFGAPVQDEKYAACFNVKYVADLNHYVDIASVWCCSDVFEEIIQLNKPFVGSFGLITIDGIEKPSFWAFKIMSQLGKQKLALDGKAEGDVEYSAYKKGKDLQVLVYAQSMDYAKKETNHIEVEIPFKAGKVTGQFIDDKHCNPKGLWVEMGKPDVLTPAQVKEIKAKSKLTAEKLPFKAEGDKTVVTLDLQTNDTCLITISPK
jgi:xylan 1,4-beta-xylosidase